MTDGLEVLVQLVIAAITTEPWRSSCASPPSVTCAEPAAAGSGAIGRAPAFGFAAASMPGSAAANDRLTSLSATRSCGRLGPARLGWTVPRSSSSVSE